MIVNGVRGDFGPAETFTVAGVGTADNLAVSVDGFEATISFSDTADEYLIYVTDTDLDRVDDYERTPANVYTVTLDGGNYEVRVTPRRILAGGAREDGTPSEPVSFTVGSALAAPGNLQWVPETLHPNNGEFRFSQGRQRDRLPNRKNRTGRHATVQEPRIVERRQPEQPAKTLVPQPRSRDAHVPRVDGKRRASERRSRRARADRHQLRLARDAESGRRPDGRDLGRRHAERQLGGRPSSGSQIVNTWGVALQLAFANQFSLGQRQYSRVEAHQGPQIAPIMFFRGFSDFVRAAYPVPQGMGIFADVDARNAAGTSALRTANAYHPISADHSAAPGTPVAVVYDDVLLSEFVADTEHASQRRIFVSGRVYRNSSGGGATGVRIRIYQHTAVEVTLIHTDNVAFGAAAISQAVNIQHDPGIYVSSGQEFELGIFAYSAYVSLTNAGGESDTVLIQTDFVNVDND